MSKDTKSSMDKISFFEDKPMWLFLGWIIAALISTVFAMYFINVHYGLANEQIGSLGGAFQGTVGVAASIAGAVATIYLAKIAINLGRESNKIAARQMRNDDPIYLKARVIISHRDDLMACIHAIENNVIFTTDFAGRILNGEKSFNDAFKNKEISLTESEFQAEQKVFSNLRKNLFSSYIASLATQCSELIFSISPYILNLIASNPNEAAKRKLGTEWLNSNYLLSKAIEDLKDSTDGTIPEHTLNDVLTSCNFIIETLNWKDVSSVERIYEILINENSYRIPNDVSEYVAKFTVGMENLRKQ